MDVFPLDHCGAAEFALAIIYDGPDSGNALGSIQALLSECAMEPTAATSAVSV
jgi:hypothetical protein